MPGGLAGVPRGRPPPNVVSLGDQLSAFLVGAAFVGADGSHPDSVALDSEAAIEDATSGWRRAPQSRTPLRNAGGQKLRKQDSLLTSLEIFCRKEQQEVYRKLSEYSAAPQPRLAPAFGGTYPCRAGRHLGFRLSSPSTFGRTHPEPKLQRDSFLGSCIPLAC